MGRDRYQEMIDSISDGSIDSASPEILREYLSVLCKNADPQHNKPENVVMGITLNHVSMKQHIDKLDKQNQKTQRWVMVLAVVSIIVGAIQVFYARESDIRSREQSLLSGQLEHQQQMPEIRSAIPIRPEHPSLHRANPGQEYEKIISSGPPPK